jgi:transketolase
MRQTCLDTVYQLAKQDDRVVFIGSDLGVGTLEGMRQEFPERFFMEGISEANVVTMAAGLAMNGKIPYVNTIASFLTRRSFEQVVLDLCLHNLPVRLLSNGGGMVYAPLGPTHMTIEDLAIMRALPNMCIVAPADAEEMQRMMLASLDWPGPIYVRFAKGYDDVVTSTDEPFVIGKAVPIREGKDALILTTGITLQLALTAAEELAAKGLEAAILHLPTIKPFDDAAVTAAIDKVPVVVSVEEHSIVGGLGGAVAELIAEADFGAVKRFKRLGLPDCFPEDYGSQASLMNHYGISSERIVTTVVDLRENS